MKRTRENSFLHAVQSHEGYYKDRPVLSSQNQSARLLAKLIEGEVEECLVLPDHTGKIDGFTVRDYRQQEISDVWILSLSLLTKFTDDLDAGWQEDLATRSLHLEDSSLIPPHLRAQQGIPEAFQNEWTPEHERVFCRLLLQIQWHQQQASAAAFSHDAESIRKHCDFMLQLSWTALRLFVSESFQAIMEKLARNMLKYLAQGSDTEDYVGYAKSRKKIWAEINGNPDFYGLDPVVPTQPLAVLR